MISNTFEFSYSIHSFDINCKRGDTFSAAFTFTGKDYTGYSFRCEVRDIIARRLILQFIPTLSGTNIITLNKSASQLVVPAGTYNYDIAVIEPDGGADTDIVKGKFIVSDDVSDNNADILIDENGDAILSEILQQEVLDYVSNLLSKTIPYTSVIPFNSYFSKISDHTVSSDITFTKSTTNQFPGASAYLTLIANGSNDPDLSNFKIGTNSADYDNRSGIKNNLFFFFDGTYHWVTIWQEQNAQPIDIVNPVLQSAVVSNANTSRVVLTYNENLANVIPSTSDFTISGKTVTSITISGAIVNVNVNTAFTSADTIAISYIPGTNKIQDTAGNLAASLSNQSVTNNIESGQALLLSSGQNIVQSGSNWLAQGGSSYDNQNAISTKKIANGSDGHVITDIPNANSENAIIGFKTTNAIPTGYGDLSYGVWLYGSDYYVLQSPQNSGISKGVNPEKLWIGRESGIIKAKRSTNGGNTWDEIMNWGAITGDLFIVATINTAGNSIFNPIGYNVQNA